MDIDKLATDAVEALTPYWTAGATEAAKTAGRSLYSWLEGKLTGSGAEALAKLEAEPGKARNADRLKADLEELLEANPALENELQALLPKAVPGAVTQTIVQTASHGTAAQATHGSTTTIQR